MAWPKAMPIVEVVWIDSTATERWITLEEMNAALDDDTLECRSAGYLLRDQDDRITILLSQSSCGNVANAITIPRSAIRKMSVLKSSTKRITRKS